MKRSFQIAAMFLAASCLAGQTHAQHRKTAPAAVPAPHGYDYAHPEVQPAKETLDLTMYARIRDEGLNRSRVMDYATALFDDIGPRLTRRSHSKERYRRAGRLSAAVCPSAYHR